MVRRRVAAGVAVVVLIIIVLVVNGCLKSQKKQSLETYNRNVSQLAGEFDSQVATPLFSALTDATSKSAIDVEEKVNDLRILAQELSSKATHLDVPGEMASAQKDLLLSFDLRVEGMTKLAALVPTAIGGQSNDSAAKIAGAMETFLASDVVYSQRVAPLIHQALSANGIQASTQGTRFLPNIGWLETSTVTSRITGQSSTGSQNGGIAPGTHGSSLVGTAVGTTALEVEPALNRISGGSNPTFTVTVENTGEDPETNVKVDVTVTAAGKTRKATHTINSTTPGNKVNVEIPIEGVSLGVASKVAIDVEGVPGETNTENNKSSYIVIFGE
jgi:uncharacterized repeat protein (TIGR01451 family)